MFYNFISFESINAGLSSFNMPHLPSGDVFFVGDGDEDSGIGFDLSVLAHSNHTVMSRGTFSMWGAILCGGEQYSEYGTIVPTSLQE